MKKAVGILMTVFLYQGVSQTCTEPSLSQFSSEVLASGLNHPVHMSVHPDGRVFFINQWTGYLGLFTPGRGVSQIGSVSVASGIEDGGLGIALDPDFDNSGWLYIFHTSNPIGSHILARYTFNNGSIGSRKEILRFDRTIVNSGNTADHDQRHAGGGVAFDNRTGYLYISTGDDSFPFEARYGARGQAGHELIWDAQRTSANTNDLRGKTLRILPMRFDDSQSPSPGEGSTYEIPSGNLKEVYSGLWDAQELDLVRPEIYTMGHRNPYRVKIDPLTSWLWISEVGPDAETNDPALGPRGYDEINLAVQPGNYGWPYAIANNQAYIGQSYDGWSVGTEFDLDNLQNLSPNNSGVTRLPPATGSVGYYNSSGTQPAPLNDLGGDGESAIMAGPYMYDPNLNSSVKFPPYFHRKVFGGDWYRRNIFWLELDGNRNLADAREFLRNQLGILHMTDFAWGPDGSLYVLIYSQGIVWGNNEPTGGSIMKINYNGPQYAPSLCSWIVQGCTDPSAGNYDPSANLDDGSCAATPVREVKSRSFRKWVALAGGARRIMLPEEGAGEVILYNLRGERVVRLQADVGIRQIDLPEHIHLEGLYYVEFK